MPACSTRRWRRSNGATCRTRSSGGPQAADAVAVVDGRVVRRGARALAVTLGQSAAAVEPPSRLRGTRAPGLSAEGWLSTDHMNDPYGVHIAVARVDRETGGVAIERY